MNAALKTYQTPVPTSASVPQDLTDCHAAEHLLMGTHNVDATSVPVCLTCRFQERAA